LIYKSAPVLMEMEPESTVSMLLSKQSHLTIAEVMPDHMLATSPSFLGHLNSDFEGNEVNFAIFFLTEMLASFQLRFGHGKRDVDPSGSGSGSGDSQDVNALDEYSDSASQQRVSTEDSPDSPLGLPSFEGLDPVLLHTLVWLLAKYGTKGGAGTELSASSESELLSLLTMLHELAKGGIVRDGRGGVHYCDTQSFATFVDIDYDSVLRQCRRFRKPRSGVLALLLLDLHEQAVLEALAIDVAFAKKVVLRLVRLGLVLSQEGGDDGEQASKEAEKRLWMLIAKHIIASEETSSSHSSGETAARQGIELIKESNGVITIDDLLPHLPNFTEIDLFKDEICHTLEQCGSKVLALKAEMEELAESTESTVKELESMKNRAYTLSSCHQTCEYCKDSLLGANTQFYLFPCSHGFHSSCLLKRAPRHLDPSQLAAVRALEDELSTLGGGRLLSVHGVGATVVPRRMDVSDHRTRARIEAVQAQLDGYIAGDCPLCGYSMVRSVSLSLISSGPGSKDAAEAKAWEL
jgi:DNA-binding IscR family transcriptional regulator